MLGKLVLSLVKRERTRVGTTTLTIYEAVMCGIIEGIRPCGGSPLRWTNQIKAAINGINTRRAAREEWWRLVKRTITRTDDHHHSANSAND